MQSITKLYWESKICNTVSLVQRLFFKNDFGNISFHSFQIMTSLYKFLYSDYAYILFVRYVSTAKYRILKHDYTTVKRIYSSVACIGWKKNMSFVTDVLWLQTEYFFCSRCFAGKYCKANLDAKRVIHKALTDENYAWARSNKHTAIR